MKFQEKLESLKACSDAVEWCKSYPSLQKAWDACERPDWSLWLIGKLSGVPGSNKRKKLVLCACECARLTLQYVPNGEMRPRKAIETAEKWARGGRGISLQDVRDAANAAAYAANATAYAANATVYAANAAAYAAAYVANAAANAANAAANAAYSAANTADAAYAVDAAKKETQIKCADVVRKHYPKAPRLK